MYKIAHISDIHIKNAKHVHFEFFNKILKSIKKNDVDHILLTGDIVDYANPEEFRLVKNTLELFGYYHKDKLSVIPGNHDIYGGPSDKVPSYLYIQNSKKLNFKKTVTKFVNQFSEIQESKNFPYLKNLGDNISVIGLNSIYEWDLHKNATGTNGYVHKNEIKKLERILNENESENKIKIILIHHHFNEPMFRKSHIEQRLWLESEEYKMKLYNKRELSNIFEKYGVKFVLHGHTHISESYKINDVTYVNSSGCVNPFTKEKKREYHIITVGNNKTKIEKLLYEAED
jgi:Icc protein